MGEQEKVGRAAKGTVEAQIAYAVRLVTERLQRLAAAREWGAVEVTVVAGRPTAVAVKATERLE